MHLSVSISLKPEEIGSVIKKRIESYREKLNVDETGEVTQAGDGVARIYGLKNAMAGELLEFDGGALGMALNLEEDNVCAVILGSDASIREGCSVRLTGGAVDVPAGDSLLGRVINPLGAPLDRKGPIKTRIRRPVEKPAPGVMSRQAVNVPLQTGIKAIDALVPIGRGQRELIIGDRQTGKTALCLDAIINQKGSGVYCVYVAVGQKASTVASIAKTLADTGASDYTAIVAATAADSAPLQFLAPYAGCAIAEEWMERGKDVLIVYDDLSKHAAAYRAMSLLLRRPPGREAYPGDIFYVHSRLLERAARLSFEYGGGSMTALPVVETQAGDISAYIPTNVISITDGQIFLEAELFNSGQRPAVNPGLSVSRVGGDAQCPAMKKNAGPLRVSLARYRELRAFSQFGAELDKETLSILTRGEALMEVLKQPQYRPMKTEHQSVLFHAAVNGLLADIPASGLKDFEEEFLRFAEARYRPLLTEISLSGAISAANEVQIKEAVESFKRRFLASR